MTITDQIFNNNTSKGNKNITLIANIRERIYGPTTFAYYYWERIDKGGDPNDF
jgi:hypothetical protein